MLSPTMSKKTIMINIYLEQYIFFYSFHPPKISLNFLGSSLLSVIPLPIFSCSGAQSLRSYLGSLLFQLIKFNSFDQPLLFSDRAPTVFLISYFISAI